MTKLPFPAKEDYINWKVKEPLAVRLAGEYDVWDKRDPDAELFQHGLRSRELTDETWKRLLNPNGEALEVQSLLLGGKALQYARTHENESVIKEIGFTLKWEGLTFLACNAARYNSLLFTAGLQPEHDACFGFKWTGKDWSVSLYHAPGKEHIDLSLIAVKYGGGGHRGACGFRASDLAAVDGLITSSNRLAKVEAMLNKCLCEGGIFDKYLNVPETRELREEYAKLKP